MSKLMDFGANLGRLQAQCMGIQIKRYCTDEDLERAQAFLREAENIRRGELVSEPQAYACRHCAGTGEPQGDRGCCGECHGSGVAANSDHYEG